MKKVLIAYIVVQIVFCLVAALVMVMVVQGTSKPKKPSKCPGKNFKEASGTTCAALKPLGTTPVSIGDGFTIDPPYLQCLSQNCSSNTTWTWGCTSQSNTYNSFCTCSSLNGKPVTYWVVAAVLVVLPMARFFPFIFKKSKKHV